MTLKLNGSTAGSVSIDAPADTSPTGTDVTLTLPTSAGSSGQYLQTNGSGTLSWQTVEGLPDAIDVNASAPADSVNIDASGRLLVGTSTSTGLYIPSEATTFQPTFQISGSSGSSSAAAALQITDTSGGNYAQGGAIFLTKDSGSSGVPNNWTLGSIYFNGEDTSGTPKTGALIAAKADGQTWASGDCPTRLEFSTTADGASSPTERMRISAEGHVFGAGKNHLDTYVGSEGWALSDAGTHGRFNVWSSSGAGTTYPAFFYHSGGSVGNISTTSSATAYNTSSDYRLKENVVPLTGAADRLNQLQVRRFNFIADPDTTVDGFLAHEAQAVVPEAVTGTHNEVEVWEEGEELPDGVSVGDNKLDEDGNTIPKYQGIDQSKLVPLLTAALQEAIGKIETLETANASQAATIAAFEARLTALEGGAS